MIISCRPIVTMLIIIMLRLGSLAGHDSVQSTNFEAILVDKSFKKLEVDGNLNLKMSCSDEDEGFHHNLAIFILNLDLEVDP